MDERIRNFCQQQREWLDLELHCSQETKTKKNGKGEEDDERKGEVLSPLDVCEVSVGLYGRTVVQFEHFSKTNNNNNNSLLPSHRFTTGDEVEILRCDNSSNKSSNTASGVISEVTETTISVALFSDSKNNNNNKSKSNNKSKNNERGNNDDDEDNSTFENPPYSLIPRSNLEVHQKMITALSELETKGIDHPIAGKIIHALFEAQPVLNKGNKQQQEPIHPFNPYLDNSQLDAISFSLSSNLPVSLIHGPPGTGKTTTVVELIRQAVHNHRMRVLVTAPSNVAVDNVLAKLVNDDSNSNKKTKIRVVRLGHPARLQANILPYSLEALVQNADGTEIVADARGELKSYLKIMNSPKSKSGTDKRLIYREIKLLRKEIRTREEKVVQELLDNANVILSTCVGAANTKLLNNTHGFDLVVIDEAAQALEAACWIPTLRAKTKLVLAGDHCQLPPTIKSNNPVVQKGLGRTMFERCMELYGEESGRSNGRVSRMLKVQYRMNERIADWASQALYGGELQTHDSVRSRTLGQFLEANSAVVEGKQNIDADISELTDIPLLLLDTAGCAMYETENEAGSRYNEGEAQLVIQHVRKLIQMGIQQDQIAVITPYNGQVEILRLSLLPDFPKLQIRSVDGFQGGEREAVVLSLVRSSERGGMKGIGFLRDNRRLNVAVTRAKRHCCVICDTETVSKSSFVSNLIDWIENHGEQRSAIEFMSDSHEQIESDVGQAEAELRRLTEEAYAAKDRKSNEVKQKVPKEVDVEERRQALRLKIEAFQSNAIPGDVMTLSSELTKLDRKLVHEIAEQLGLLHQSEGVEGVNRRINITIPHGESHSPASATAVQDETAVEMSQDVLSEGEEVDVERSLGNTSNFALLEEDDGTIEDENENLPETEQPMNNLLADLARQREERSRQNQAAAPAPTQSTSKKSKKKKGQKLGGAKKPVVKEDQMEGLDDMEYLDAQVKKVQNSHGRKLEGTGSNYKAIMSGYLLPKPKTNEKKKDPKASSALQKKLKEAQNARKAKPKKK